MDWGDAAGWAAFAISGAALWVSMRAQRDGRRSANAAEASVEEARRSGDAAVRSAVAAELTLADQQREAEDRRAAEAEANRPRPLFQIERSGRHSFVLRNRGTAAAEGITLRARVNPYRMDRVENVALLPEEGVPFVMAAGGVTPLPRTLYVTWVGQSEEVPLAVPAL